MAELKTKPTKASALEFIKKVSEEGKRKDSLALLKIFKEATGQKPQMWGKTGVGPRRKGTEPTGSSRGRAKSQQRLMGGRGIVGYGMYHYKSERSSQEGDWPLVGFSPRKQNLTLYIMPGFAELKDLLKKLGKHKTSVGCLYINKLSDIDTKVLTQIVKKSYALMKKKYKA